MGSCNSGGKGNGSGGLPFTKGKPIPPDVAVNNANAKRASNGRGYQENCQRCAWAFEMQRRGYDVEALPSPKDDYLCKGDNWMRIAQSKLTKDFVGASSVKTEVANITYTMQNWGEGSRGIVRMVKGGDGHAFNVEYKNGKVVAYDAQTGWKGSLTSILSGSIRNYTSLVRSDNVKFNPKEVSKYVKERGSK